MGKYFAHRQRRSNVTSLFLLKLVLLLKIKRKNSVCVGKTSLTEKSLLRKTHMTYDTWWGGAVMNEYNKKDTNKYSSIFGCHIMHRTNIRIYSNATYLQNKYPNIFVLRKQHDFKYESYLRVILLQYSIICTHQ